MSIVHDRIRAHIAKTPLARSALIRTTLESVLLRSDRADLMNSICSVQSRRGSIIIRVESPLAVSELRFFIDDFRLALRPYTFLADPAGKLMIIFRV